MKILVIDDNPRRYQKLLSVLGGRGIQRDAIDIVTCAMDARGKLEKNKYDLMIIDIVLPLRPEDERADERHSQELLSELLEEDDLIKPRKIIGLSAFEDITEKVAPFFRDHVWAVIPYSDSNDAWIQQVANSVKYLREEESAQSKRLDHEIDIAIVCALADPELRAILSLPWNWKSATPIDDVNFVYEGYFLNGGQNVRVVAASASRMGMVSAALLSSKIIHIFRPRFIAMAGICAGVRGKVNLGDVLLADPSWDWQSGKRVRDDKNSVFSVAPHQLQVAPSVRSCFEQLKEDRTLLLSIASGWEGGSPGPLRFHVGPVASGSAVLADGNVVAEISRQHRELIGIEMEAYGVYSAAVNAGHPRPIPLAVKSVCDFADPDKNDNYQRYAAYNSANAIRHLFERNYARLKDCL